MVRTALKAQEMERNKIGQELHDNVNQILASTRLYINMMQDGGSAPVDLSQRLKSGIDLAISEIRKLSNAHITPPEKMGLQELIENLVSSLNENEMVATVFQCQIQEDLIIDQELRTNLYRIVQEQTNNILKYAKASSASITISCEQDRLKMVIADNGKGFDMTASRNGIGIYNMINRVSSFNGELQIETAPGTGCTIRVSIPLHA